MTIERLQSGELGLRLTPAAGLRVLGGDDRTWSGVDDSQGLQWILAYEDGLHLDLRAEVRPHLEASMQWVARDMFEQVFANQILPNAPKGFDPPNRRTDDASWSPMVEVVSTELAQAPALRLVHRMVYVRGNELVMGHVLVPLARGLFEARGMAADRQTGMREVAVMTLTQQVEPERFANDPFGGLRQADYDAEANDARFPAHCLSRVRHGLAGFASAWNVSVASPAAPHAPQLAVMPSLGCSVTPPPRFVPTDDAGVFRRASFCVTDGVDVFLVEKQAATAKPQRLAEHARRESHRFLEGQGFEGLELEVSVRESGVLVNAVGRGHQGLLRTVLFWCLDGAGRAWTLTIAANPAAAPADVLAAELEASARTFRLLDPPAASEAQKPWWKRW